MAQQVHTSSTTWTCPAGVTSVAIWCYGGGGGGGGATISGGNGSGGGGGGAFAFANVSVTPGNVYTVTVGAGGTGVSGGNGNNGGDSWFSTTSTVIAKGGNGGVVAGAAGNGGASASCIGTIVFSGGNGSVGASGQSGAGGGGAGWQAAGGAASGTTKGAAGNGGVAGNDPGAGHAGTTGSQTNGAGGTALGGAGSGAIGASTQTGGAGANGLVVLEYGTSSVNQVQMIMAASGNTAGTSASVSWPTATTAGNLLVAILTNSVAMATLTPPASWTVGIKDVANANPEVVIYYIQNASSRSGAESWTISSGRWTLELREYSGILTTAALGGTSWANTTGTTISTGATSSNPLTSNDLVIAAVRQASNTGTFSSPTATSGTVDFMNDLQQTSNSVASLAIVGGVSASSTETISITSSPGGVTEIGVIAIFGAAPTSTSPVGKDIMSLNNTLGANINQAVNRAGTY